MAQSQNTKIEFQTTGTSYLGIGGKVGKFLVGDKALEFYADATQSDDGWRIGYTNWYSQLSRPNSHH